MSAHPLRVAVIVASTREGRFGPTVAAWFAGEAAARTDVDAEIIDLAGPDPDGGLQAETGPGAETEPITARLAAADVFVIVTPEYNHSYPAPLKAVIDSHFREWHAKPVGFVSYGGLSGGLRAVEHLRPVFAELHAVTVRDTVSFHGGRSCFGPDGRPLDPREPGAAAHRLLDRLTWWGVTLRDAHQARPYVAV
ncbi:NADPH-dependent FMN reductase [Actinoplanes sp. NPDC004185]